MNIFFRSAFLASMVLLSSFVSSEFKEIQSDGDWSYYYDPDDIISVSATFNTSDQIFGQFCNALDQSCYYMMSLDVACVSEEETPALLNTSAGVYAITLICDQELDDGDYRYYLTPFDNIDDAVRNSTGQIGIAMGLQGGKFAVERYSLFGSVKSIDEMRSFTSEVIDIIEQNDDSSTLESSETL